MQKTVPADLQFSCSSSVCSEVTTEDEETPEPISPDEIEIDVNYEPDPTDLVLSSVPGGELFNPRKHKFSEEELKPQPMIKKAKKIFVPEEQKVQYIKQSSVLFTACVHGLFYVGETQNTGKWEHKAGLKNGKLHVGKTCGADGWWPLGHVQV